MSRYSRPNDSGNVAVVLLDAQSGDKLDFERPHVTITEPVPHEYKAASCDPHAGDIVYKYGYSIGKYTRDIPQGGQVHVHNIINCRGEAGK